MAYPTEAQKGRFISIFWAIFNLGGVVGAAVALGQNIHSKVRSWKTRSITQPNEPFRRPIKVYMTFKMEILTEHSLYASVGNGTYVYVPFYVFDWCLTLP